MLHARMHVRVHARAVLGDMVDCSRMSKRKHSVSTFQRGGPTFGSISERTSRQGTMCICIALLILKVACMVYLVYGYGA